MSQISEIPFNSSLTKLVRKRILDDMLNQVPKGKNWRIMIVDEGSLAVINSVCKVSEIVKKDVTVVEYLKKDRQPFPQMNAIYFIEPTSDSIERMLNDLKNKTYGYGYVFFIRRVPPSLISKIQVHPGKKRLKCLIEMGLDFVVVEERVFSLNGFGENSIQFFFGNQLSQKAKNQSCNLVGNQLSSFFATIGEFPLIRYQSNSNISERVAQRVQQVLGQLYSKMNKSGSKKKLKKENSVCLILDRSVDAVAPLLHEFTYQSMIYDLLKVGENKKYKYSFISGKNEENSKDVLLSDNDDIFKRYKHEHIVTLNKKIQKEREKFYRSNKELSKLAGVTFSKEEEEENNEKKNKNNSKLTGMIHNLPEFMQKSEKYSLHNNIYKKLNSIFNEQQLAKIALEEQNMVMGNETPEGKKISNVLAQISKILKNPENDEENKMRLIMIYMITKGGVKQDKINQIIKASGLDEEQARIINNLSVLGVLKKKTISKKISSLFNIGGSKNKDEEEKFNLSRYTPKIKILMEELISKKISIEDYPYLTPPHGSFSIIEKNSKKEKFNKKSGYGNYNSPISGSSLRSNAASSPSWMKSPSSTTTGSSSKIIDDSIFETNVNQNQKNKNTKRLIIFVIGGITHSEMRSCYEICKKYNYNEEYNNNLDVFIGGTNITSPSLFLKSLQKIQKL